MSRIKVLTISDHPLFHSGVAHTMRNIILALLKSNKFDVISLGGAIKHSNYTPQRLEEWKERWTIIPVENFGTKDMVRSIIKQEKIDILLFQSDPRFFTWLLELESEIRPNVPMVWYGIWDNYPYPMFNKPIWDSVDVMASISKVTYDLVKNVSPDTENIYIPHAVDSDIFKKYDRKEVNDYMSKFMPDLPEDKFVIFWNNRNARRKQSGSLIYWFSEFLKSADIGREKATLIMHTDPHDPNGQNLFEVARHCDLLPSEIMFSVGKLHPKELAYLYNRADVTINVADAEGFGVCLDFNTIVQNQFGKIDIGNIKLGDKILSEDGKYHRVIGKVDRYKNCKKIKSYYKEDLIATDEHFFKIFNKKTQEFTWKQVKNLVPKEDCFVLPKDVYKNLFDSPNDVIDLLDWIEQKEILNLEYDQEYIWSNMSFNSKNIGGFSIKQIQEKYNVSKHYAEVAKDIILKGKHYKYKNGSEKVNDLIIKINKDKINLNSNLLKLNRFIKIDKDFMNLAGWYLAEGSNHSNKNGFIELDFNSDELEYAKKLKDIILNKFGDNLNCQIESYDNKCRLIVCSKILSLFFGKFFGIYSNNKHIPKELIGHKDINILIKSLFLGDGHDEKNSNSYKLTTTSKILAYQVNEILYNQNILNSIKNLGIRDKGNYEIFIISLLGKNYFNFINYINNTDNKIEEIFTIIDEVSGYYTFPIIEIIEDGEHHVIDIQVEDSANFIANGIVSHNSTLESLSCGTPIIVNMTGGLQEQVTDGKHWFGIGIEPASKALIGSQDVPYIFEDRVSKEDVVNSLREMYHKSNQDREKLGRYGMKHVKNNYSFEQFNKTWVRLMEDIHQNRKSWPTVGYNSWELLKF